MHAMPLTDDCLEPFATRLRAHPGERTVYPVVTEPGDSPGKPVFSIMTHAPVEGDIVVTKLERHPHTSQSFLALNSDRWLVIVAPTKADGDPDVDKAMAFIAGSGDAICFHRNVWHAPLTVLGRPADMAMMMWKVDSGDDNAFYDLPKPLVVTV